MPSLLSKDQLQLCLGGKAAGATVTIAEVKKAVLCFHVPAGFIHDTVIIHSEKFYPLIYFFINLYIYLLHTHHQFIIHVYQPLINIFLSTGIGQNGYYNMYKHSSHSFKFKELFSWRGGV
jgi:hypothetical protein